MTNPPPQNGDQNGGNGHTETELQPRLDSQTIALRIIAGLLILGAISLLAKLFVPFILALVLAIAFSPLAGRLERWGLPPILGALSCVGIVALVILLVMGLLGYQLGGLVQESDQYFSQLRSRFIHISESIGGDQMLSRIGLTENEAEPPLDSEPAGIDSEEDDPLERLESNRDESGRSGLSPAEREAEQGEQKEQDGQEEDRFWDDLLESNLEAITGWIFNGIGGAVGIVGQLVVLLAFLLFMLLTREEWSDRILRAAVELGLRPRRATLEGAQAQIRQFIGYVFLVACSYGIVVTLLGWSLGLPSPAAWGVLAGLAMFIPYVGPVITGTVLTLVALATSDSLWKPATVLGVYVLLQTIESYAITPMLYGRAVAFNPVSVLFGVLFFGWLLGPLGLITALPLMVLLRALVQISSDTPALHTLVDKEKQEA